MQAGAMMGRSGQVEKVAKVEQVGPAGATEARGHCLRGRCTEDRKGRTKAHALSRLAAGVEFAAGPYRRPPSSPVLQCPFPSATAVSARIDTHTAPSPGCHSIRRRSPRQYQTDIGAAHYSVSGYEEVAHVCSATSGGRHRTMPILKQVAAIAARSKSPQWLIVSAGTVVVDAERPT